MSARSLGIATNVEASVALSSSQSAPVEHPIRAKVGSPIAPQASDSWVRPGPKIIRSVNDVHNLLGVPQLDATQSSSSPSVSTAQLARNGKPREQHQHGDRTSAPLPPQPDFAQIAAEARAEGNVPTAEERADDVVYRSLVRSQQIITFGRLSLGAQLVDVRDREIWRGRCAAKTFRGFLLEEGIDPRSACQYMQVVRCFVHAYGFDVKTLSGSGIALLHEMAVNLSVIEMDRLGAESFDPTATLKRLKAMDGFGVQPLPSPDRGFREAIGELVMAMQQMAKAEARALLADRTAIWRDWFGLGQTDITRSPSHPAPVTAILGQVDALSLEQRSDLFRLLGRKPEKISSAGQTEKVPARECASIEKQSTVAAMPPASVPSEQSSPQNDDPIPFWRRGLRA